MRCEEVMRRDVIVVNPDTTLREAARRMREGNVGFLPVCVTGDLVGLLTDRDIVVRACSAGLDLDRTAVASIMTTDPTTCRADSSLSAAERTMRTMRRARLPIVDSRGRLVGVLSLSDIAQYETTERTGQIVFDVAQRKYDPRT